MWWQLSIHNVDTKTCDKKRKFNLVPRVSLLLSCSRVWEEERPWERGWRKLAYQNTYYFVISRCCFAEDGREMYKDSKRRCRTMVLLIKRQRSGLLKLPSQYGQSVRQSVSHSVSLLFIYKYFYVLLTWFVVYPEKGLLLMKYKSYIPIKMRNS